MSAFECFDEAYEIEPCQRLLLESLVLPAPRDHESFTRWLAEKPDDFASAFALIWKLLEQR